MKSVYNVYLKNWNLYTTYFWKNEICIQRIIKKNKSVYNVFLKKWICIKRMFEKMNLYKTYIWKNEICIKRIFEKWICIQRIFEKMKWWKKLITKIKREIVFQPNCQIWQRTILTFYFAKYRLSFQVLRYKTRICIQSLYFNVWQQSL